MIVHRINFPLYGIIILLSIIIGCIYIYKNLKKEGIEKRNIIYFFLMMVPFAYICGILYTIAINIDKPFSVNSIGLSAYGGLLGVVFAAIIFDKIIYSKGIITKYSVLSLPLIYGLSKIACSVAGCCYGIPYNGPLAINYIDVHDEFVFPIQLLEVISSLIVFVILNKFKNNKNITYITMICVSIIKCSLDFLRYDHTRMVITPNQIFSILLFITTIVLFMINKKSIMKK